MEREWSSGLPGLPEAPAWAGRKGIPPSGRPWLPSYSLAVPPGCQQVLETHGCTELPWAPITAQLLGCLLSPGLPHQDTPPHFCPAVSSPSSLPPPLYCP